MPLLNCSKSHLILAVFVINWSSVKSGLFLLGVFQFARFQRKCSCVLWSAAYVDEYDTLEVTSVSLPRTGTVLSSAATQQRHTVTVKLCEASCLSWCCCVAVHHSEKVILVDADVVVGYREFWFPGFWLDLTLSWVWGSQCVSVAVLLTLFWHWPQCWNWFWAGGPMLS